MIAGVGIDTVDLARFAAAYARHGAHLERRLMAPSERRALPTAARARGRRLALAFAAKEAFAKALGTGLRYPASLHQIALERDAAGRPRYRLGTQLAALLAGRGIGASHLSLSDDGTSAVALALLEHGSATAGAR